MATANEFALVTQLTGQAWVRGQDGALTPLRVGMRVPADAEIVTADGSSVQLQIDGVPALTISSDRTVQLASEMAMGQPDAAQEAISEPGSTRLGELAAVLDQGQDPFEDLDPTAATLAGGGGDGNGFVRLLSVLEPVRPLGLEYPRPGGAPDELPRLPGGIGGNNQNPQALLPASLSLTHNDSQTILPVSLAQYFSDADGDALTYTATGLPPGLSIHPVTGEITGTLDKSASQGGNNGVYTVVVTVTDPAGGSATLTFPWTALNPPPVAEDDTNTTEENTVVTGNVLTGGPGGAGQDSDPDGDTIVVTEIVNVGGDKVPAGTPILGDNGGSFVINPDGSYTFTPGTSFDYLADGETTTTRVTYTISDGEGGTDTAELIITITGSNDGPTIVSAGTDASTTVTEIADNAAGENTTEHARAGSIQFADLDTSDTHTASFQPVAAGYLGTFALGAVDDAGNTVGWTFKVDDSAIDHLAAGQTLTQEYDVTIDDGKGGTTVQRVTVTITGTNDAPIITSAAHDVTVTEVADGAANENTELHRVGGDILFADVDLTDGHTVAQQPKNTGYLGNFQVGAIDAATKTVTWDFTLLDGDIDSLAQGQTLVQVYTVTITDTAGATTTQDVTVRIVGTNDAPIMSGETTGAVKEDGTTTATGQLDKTDVDLTDTHTWTLDKSGQGEYGNFTIDQTGKWTYNLTNTDPRVQALKEGETLTDKILVTVTDTHGATDTKEVVITITGTNDGPEVVPPVPGSLDQTHNDSQTITPVDMSPYFKDVDGETLTYSADGLPPGLSIDKDSGIISGTLDKSASQGGNNGVYTVVVTVKDPSGASTTLEFPWKALNPPPVAEDDTNTTEENTVATGNVLTGGAGGVGQDSDPDGDDIKVTEIVNAAGDKVSVGSPITGDNGGSFVINADGSYVFTPGTTFDYLAVGESTTTRVTYTISDGEGGTDTAELIITITGSNDGPTIVSAGTDASTTVTEIADNAAGENNTEHSRAGSIQFADLDTSDTHTASFASKATGYLGTFALGAVDNAGNTVGWTFKVDDSAIDHLAAGQTLTQEYDVTIDDGKGGTTVQRVTVTITGTNDAPIIDEAVSDLTGAVTEDATVATVGGTVQKDDVDLTDTHTWDVVTGSEAKYGTLTINNQGVWEYTLDNTNSAVKALGAGATLKDRIEVRVTDSANATDTTWIEITITGTNDVPDVTDDAKSVKEDVNVDSSGFLSVDGAVTITDTDAGESKFDTATLAFGNTSHSGGQLGAITSINADGTYTYKVDNSKVQFLNVGDTIVEKYTVKSADGTKTSTITITIHGTNDGPQAKPDVNTVMESGVKKGGNDAEAGTVQASGNVITDTAGKDTDADAGASLTVKDVRTGTDGAVNAVSAGAGTVVQTTYGTLTLQADGTYTYVLKNNDPTVQALKADATVKDVFTYTVTDEHGATATTTLTITITGTNDIPTIEAGTQLTGSVTEQGVGAETASPVASGNLVAADVDDGASLTWSLRSGNNNVTQMDGTYGAIKVVKAGDGSWKWEYTLDNSKAATQALKQGETKVETFTVRVEDEHGAWVNETVRVTVTGTNDAPVASNETATFIEDKPNDGTSHTGNVLTNDINQEGPLTVTSFTIDGIAGTHAANGTAVSIGGIGTFSLAANGKYVFTPAQHYSGPVPTITYTVAEPEGDNPGGPTLTATATLTITVTPDADQPILTVIKPVQDTNEDVSITLGLKAPEVVDYTDHNTSANAGDNPERLGPITLEGIPAGVTLTWAGGGSYLSTGAAISIVLDETDPKYQHTTGATGTLTLTKAQYESLAVSPKAHDAKNFDVTVKVTSYEVDAAGNPLTGTPAAGSKYSADSTTTVKVDVLAVTDDVTLTFAPTAAGTVNLAMRSNTGTAQGNIAVDVTEVTSAKHIKLTGTINEDSQINLKTLLKAAFQDLDGSEDRWITITNKITGETIRVNSSDLASGSTSVPLGRGNLQTDNNLSKSQTGIGDIWFGGKVNDSGVLTGQLEITLHAQDRDYDSQNNGSNPYRASEKTDTVILDLNLNINPVVDGLTFADVTTPEDKAIAFLKNIKLNDTDGSETLTSIKIKASSIPDGAIIKDNAGNVIAVKDGNVLRDKDGNDLGLEVEILPAAGADTAAKLALLKAYTVTPPAHSSKDFTLEFTYAVTDSEAGVVTDIRTDLTGSVKVAVTPVAERVDTDTDGKNGNDLTMTPGHAANEAYNTTVGEDGAWFNLNQGIDLRNGWTNEDGKESLFGGAVGGSEDTFALLTPELVAGKSVAGDSVLGSQFRYHDGNDWVVKTYNGQPVEVPVQFLNTLEFKAPAQVAGEFRIGIQAKTVDADVDSSAVDTQISGQAYLNGIVVTAVADKVTLSVGGTSGSAYGKEDTFIGLSIRPTSSDKSETFNVRISDIPPGATLKYNGQELDLSDPANLPAGITVVTDGGKTWLQIDNFDQSKDLAIKPPLNSNDDFTLTVQSQSVDSVPGQAVDLSDWTQMPLPVRVKGVADDATLTTVEKTYEEQVLDGSGNGIALKDLVTGYTLVDADSSETLSLKITGLADGFTVVGATFLGGDGAGREWVLTYAQLQSGAVKIVVPQHYSGEVKAQVIPITTENDGDWKESAPHDVKAIITPSPESTGTPSSSIKEDTLSKLTFAVVHNGDDDETLGRVYIKAADVDDQAGFTIFLHGKALKDAGLTLENGYYVLEKSQYDNLYAKTSPNFAHNLATADELKFGVKYEIIDPTTDGSGPAVTTVIETEHNLVVTPVTDPVKAQLDGFTGDASIVTTNGDTLEISGRGAFGVNLDLSKLNDTNANNQPDYDGSEKLISVYVNGVPNGLNVTGLVVDGVSMGTVSMIGNGVWVIALPAASYPSFTKAIDATVQFEAGPFLANTNALPITITVGTQDNGAATVASDSVTWKLTATGEGPGTAPSTQLDFKPNDNFQATEDKPFTMDQAFDATLSEDAKLSLVLELPGGATVTYQGQPVVPTTVVGDDGQVREIWVVNGNGKAGDLADFLKDVEITPPADWNDGRGDKLLIDATLTAHSPNGSQSQVDVDGHQVPVNPVTDAADIGVTFGVPGADGKTTNEAPKEGKDVAIQISVGSSVDGPTEIGDVVYVRVTEGNGFNGGQVYTADAYANGGSPLVLQTVGADNALGLPAGQYYVLPVDEADRQLAQGERLLEDLVYVPKDGQEYLTGSVKVEAWVRNTESGSDLTKDGSGSGQTTLVGVDNEYDLEVGTKDGSGTWIVSGDENQSSTAGDGKIQLDVNGSLKDTDSEQVYAAFIKGLPNGFLVYVGDDAASANVAVLANNAGVSNGSPVWNLPIGADGKLPAYIAVVPPQNWSGTLQGVNLVVQSGEINSTKPPSETTAPFNLVVDAKADGLTSLTPQQAFGDEGDIIRLQLNAVMKDGVKAGATDGSVETVTLTLKGLGEFAAFYAGTDTLLNGIADKVAYDKGSDTYTIKGLSQADVDTLGVIQAAGAAQGQVTVTAQTTESLGGDTSAIQTGTFDMSIFDQRATSGNDKLLFDGENLLDGGDGEDTMWLRFGEDMDFAAVKDKLDNIEIIDLTREGFGHKLTNLGVDEVKAMTTAGSGGSHVLTIKADANDAITFKADESWVRSETKSTEGNDVYTSSQPGAGNVEVHIKSQAGSAATIAGVLEDDSSSINGLLGGASAKMASAPAPASAPLAYDAGSNQLANDLIQQGKLQSDM